MAAALWPLQGFGPLLGQGHGKQVDEALHARRQGRVGVEIARPLGERERPAQFRAARPRADDLADDDLVDAADRGCDIDLGDAIRSVSPSADSLIARER